MTREEVFDVVRCIPRGKVSTYGLVAAAAGYPRAARAVGRLLHTNDTPVVVPCHRVVFADGRTSPAFAFGGTDVQREWLEREGVGFDADGRVLLSLHLYDFGLGGR